MPLQPIPPPGLPGPQNKARELLGVLARFAARARLTGPRLAGVPAQGQMAAFKVGTLWVPFWINPMTYRETTAAIKQDQPTPGLFRRSYFTARPTRMYLEGTTGTAGWDARTGGMADLGRMKPFVASPTERIEFHYPYMFTGPRYCYVNRFVQQTMPDAPLYYYYQIELSVFPQQDNLPCRVAPQAVAAQSGVAPSQQVLHRKPKKLPTTPALARVDQGPTLQATVPIQQTVTLTNSDVPAVTPDPRIWWASEVAGGTVHKPASPAVVTQQATQAGGAATALASELRDRYNQLTWIFNRKRSQILISELSAQVKAQLAFEVVGFLTAEAQTVVGQSAAAQIGQNAAAYAAQAAATVGQAILAQGAEDLHGLNGSEYTVVLCTAFDALWHNSGAYVAGTDGTRDLWVGGLTNDWSFFEGSKTSGASAMNLPWQALLLVGPLQFSAEEPWQTLARLGAGAPADLSAHCTSFPTT